MRPISYFIALALLLAGSSLAGAPSLAGSPDSDLPGIGTFTYNGSSVSGQTAPVLATLVH